MAFWARKVLGTFEKGAPGTNIALAVIAGLNSGSLGFKSSAPIANRPATLPQRDRSDLMCYQICTLLFNADILWLF